jgi:Brp/Blh family beta-carotene 15,15'-monooxygenase
MIGAACCVSDLPAAVTAGILTLLVAVVGLPHGAADHRFARPRLEPLLGPSWLPVFLGFYATVMAAVLAGWAATPAATIVLFFLASAWHFGREDPRPIAPRCLRPVLRFARGGLVIWIPLLVHAADVDSILGIVAPAAAGSAIRQAVALLTACSWVMFAVAVAGWASQGAAAVRRGGAIRRVLLVDNALVASLVVLFAVVGPLAGFLVYFCAWHSVRGLRRLGAELGESWPQLAASLAPPTGAAIVLIGLVAWLGLGTAGWSEVLVRATFVGLSAVAMPHLLLHGVAPVLEKVAPRRPNRALSAGSPA